MKKLLLILGLSLGLTVSAFAEGFKSGEILERGTIIETIVNQYSTGGIPWVEVTVFVAYEGVVYHCHIVQEGSYVECVQYKKYF